MKNTDILKIDPNALQSISSKLAWFYRIIPSGNANGVLHCFIDREKYKDRIEDEIELFLGKKILLEPVDSNTIQDNLQFFFPENTKDTRQKNAYYHGDADSFLTHLISEAKSLKSSDIHVEIYEEKCRVRIRIDGVLVQRYILDKKQYPSLVNKIKVIANLDIAEKRLPQDGRILFEFKDEKFDIRVSVLPTLYGEKVVLRLLNSDTTNIELSALGLSEDDLDKYVESTKKRSGIILISGPTGSGKTTTLYATLKLLNNDERNITTIEDPIEYTLEGVNQVQLKENIGFNFSAALRTFLRQDPNIIMVGEIRDVDTANMAIRTALTGHLVLSTIHTNSAWGIVSRLIDMNIPPFLIANTLNMAVAQRLVRLLCPYCKIESDSHGIAYPQKFKPYKAISAQYIARGCPECHNTGYKQRKAIYEVIVIDEELAELIKSGSISTPEMLEQKGIKTLSHNAFELFEKGETSLEEIYPLLMN